MKSTVIFTLRCAIVTLLLFPLFVPWALSKRDTEVRDPITVLWLSSAPQEPSDLESISQEITRVFGSNAQFHVQKIGDSPQAHPLLVFEGLLQGVQQAKGPVVIHGPARLWGPAADVFARKLKETAAARENRLWVHQVVPATAPEDFVGLSSLDLPHLAFMNDETLASLNIQGQGKPGQIVKGEVVLRTGDSILGTLPLTVQADGAGVVDSVLTLPVTFLHQGTQVVTATLNLPQGLTSPPLDTASTTVNVAHPKSTFLHIAVGPDWSLRNLRQKLKFWPNVDIISYYILREASNDNSIPSDQLSLIEFPSEKLFGQELQNFHGIIAQNFLFENYLLPNHVENLIQYVKNGGRMFLQGGPLSFAGENPAMSSLFPCVNRDLEFNTEKAFNWEPSADNFAGDPTLFKNFSHITTHATLTGCQPKSEALVLARTREGHHPMVLSMPMGKGLVLAILAGDWHTSYVQREADSSSDRAERSLEAESVESLFQWMVEFLQRRQDSGARSPDLAGPRLYAEDHVWALRSRGVFHTGDNLTLVGLNADTSGKTEWLNELSQGILVTENTQSRGSPLGTLLTSPLPLWQEVATKLSQGSYVRKGGPWPVFQGKLSLRETHENPKLFRDTPPLHKAPTSIALNTRAQSQEKRTPPFVAWPWCLGLGLGLLALEQFLSRVLWIRPRKETAYV